MILGDISLYLRVDEYDRMYRSDFQFRSRFVCNFVRRRVKPLRFETDGFHAVAIQGSEEPGDECPIVHEKVVVSEVRFDRDHYENLKTGDRPEFFVSMLMEGIRKCSRSHRLPLAEIESAVADFRAAGYKNQWTFKQKSFRALGARVTLSCDLDAERFELSLEVIKGGIVIFDGPILETKPDETIFTHQFRNVVIEGTNLNVVNAFGESIFSLDLSANPRKAEGGAE